MEGAVQVVSLQWKVKFQRALRPPRHQGPSSPALHDRRLNGRSALLPQRVGLVTAKMTAKVADYSGRQRTIADGDLSPPNLCVQLWMSLDGTPAVFKTVCGAPMTRPGWVRFPSIPANFLSEDRQDDSHSSELARTNTAARGPSGRAAHPKLEES